MAAKTTSLANSVLDRVLKNNAQLAYAWPATVYLALFTTDPTVAGLITGEVVPTSSDYARQAMTWGTIAAGSVANSVAATYSVAAASWGTITHCGIMDASTLGAGTMLYHGPLTVPKAVGIGDQVSFAIGAVTVNEN
jgi:serine acetyltransferase